MASSLPLATHHLAVCLFDQICDLAQDGRDVNLLRLPALLAGLVAETMMDFDKPEVYLADILATLPETPQAPLPNRSLKAIDFDISLGRSLARIHLDDSLEEQSRMVLQAAHGLAFTDGFDLASGALHDMQVLYREALHLAAGYDLAAHEICNRTIDVKVAQQHWSLADCIIALSGLSGALLGRVLADAGIPVASIEDQLNDLMDMMTAEAVRHGFADKDMAHPALPANDNPTHVRFDLIKGIEHLSLTVLEELDMRDVVTQAHAMAKAAGRMVAVASVGEAPEIEGYVCRPMALLAMQGGFAASL